MSGHRMTALAAVAAASLAGSVGLAANAAADQIVVWNGQYILTLSADAKTGTSMAVGQREYAHRASYSISTSCYTSGCVATVNDPPPPKNQYLPQAIEFTWNGAQWIREMSWKWDCLLPDGTVEYDPAKSITVYTPGANGILTGVFHTDISSGACKGNVDMPVSAAPAQSPVI